MTIIYGQVVAGPPGSGKTTFCTGMQEYLQLLGRNAYVINLDPANEHHNNNNNNNNKNNNDNDDNNKLPYDTLLDICEEVINLTSVMEQLNLGPNGGLIYCMEYIQAHVTELVQIITKRISEKQQQSSLSSNCNIYLLFDLPGQVELYTHGTAVQELFQQLIKTLDLRLTAIQLIDAHYCTEAANFVSAALLGTTTMLRLELPTVNVLSKIDLLTNYGPLPFALEFFTNCQDLDRLIPFLVHGSVGNNNDDDDDEYVNDIDYQMIRKKRYLQSPFYKKHEKLHQAMAEMVQDFGLLSFIPLDISDAQSVGRVLHKIDKCNGYVFVVNEQSKTNNNNNNIDMFQCAIGQADHTHYETIADIQERLYHNNNDEDDEVVNNNTTTDNSIKIDEN